MPIALQTSGPGISGPPVVHHFGDPYGGSTSLHAAAGAVTLSGDSIVTGGRGYVGQEFSFETAMHLSDLSRLTDYNTKAISLGTSSQYAGLSSKATGIRTGSMELNLLDLNATLRQFSGPYIGQDTSLMGGPEATDFASEALGLLGTYGEAPAKILDYISFFPLAVQGLINANQTATNGPRNADNTPLHPFQAEPAYWAILSGADDATLQAMALASAQSSVGAAAVPAVTAQLLATFRQDQLSMTGLSSGNPRTDYLAKSYLQRAMEVAAITVRARAGDPVASLQLAGVGDINEAHLNAGLEGAGLSLLTFIPIIGTNIAEAINPINARTEAYWRDHAAPADRRNFLLEAQITATIADLGASMPVFGGVGEMIALTKTFAAGATLAEVSGGNALVNVGRQAAYLLAKPALRMPAALTETGTIGAKLGARFAVPATVHLTDVYDGVLHVAKLALLSGWAGFTANWAAEAYIPGYAATVGAQVDASHWVSESSYAGLVDQIGLFTGGTLGAASLARMTASGPGAVAGRLGLAESPFSALFANHFGEEATIVGKSFKLPTQFFEQPAWNYHVSLFQRWMQDMTVESAARLLGTNAEEATRIVQEMAVDQAGAATRLATLIKYANERRVGFETDAWTQRHAVVKDAARQMVDDMARMAEAENGVGFWREQLNRMTDETGKPLPYTVEGFKTYMRTLAKSMGLDVAGVDAIEGTWHMRLGAGDHVQRWQRAANSLYHYAFDLQNGTLKKIIDEGTSEEAANLTVVRQGHFFQDMYFRFRDLLASEDPAAPSPELAALFAEIKQTPEVRQWWMQETYASRGSGPRSVNDLTMEQVASFGDVVKEHLASRRSAPGPNSTPGDLNDFHAAMLEQGHWTLAFKPTVETALGAMKVMEEQARKQMDSEVAAVERRQWIYASRIQTFDNELAARRQFIEARYYAKYIAPLEDRMSVTPSDGSPGWGEMTQVTKDALTAEYLAASKRRDRAIRRDPQVRELVAKSDAALRSLEELQAEQKANPTLGYRIGPIEPPGYSGDPATVISAATGKAADPGFYGSEITRALDQMAKDKTFDPHAGEGLWHVTSDWPNVQRYGLLNRMEREAKGIYRKGLGGGNIGVSTTWSYVHAQLIEQRLKLAMDAANNRTTVEGIISHFRQSPAYQTPLEMADGLGYIVARDFHDWRNSPEGINVGSESQAAWDKVLQLAEENAVRAEADRVKNYPRSSYPGYTLFGMVRQLDDGVSANENLPHYGEMGGNIGTKVVLVGDGADLQGLDTTNIKTVRVSVRLGTRELSATGIDPSEAQFLTKDVFVHEALPDQPFRDPMEDPLTTWDQAGPLAKPVSYVQVRDPATHETKWFKSPFLDYPTSAPDTINFQNRSLLARKMDDLFRGYRTWRITEYQKAQITRLFTDKYIVAPEQIDEFIQGAYQMAYEKWGPGGIAEAPVGPQAAARFRHVDVQKLGMRVFGSEKNDLTGAVTPARLTTRAGGSEVPDYSKILVDGMRQAWHLNLTAGLTSKLYTQGTAGQLSMMFASWLIPYLRYQASPVFKTSELLESGMFNAMRGADRVGSERLADYIKMGMPSQHGQISAELAGGADAVAVGLMGALPTVEEAAAHYPGGLADLHGPFATAEAIDALARAKVANRSTSNLARQAWDFVANPTPYKDIRANSLSVQLVSRALPDILKRTDPDAYGLFHDILKVPDHKIADFIAKDRSLYQRWQDGSVTFAELEAHHTMYNTTLREQGGYLGPGHAEADLISFYRSEEWQATEAMFRLAARTGQAEAFGTHFFGSYRSTFERSINHPLLGIYPASWAYKAAKEWFKFLFDNRTFGDGELRLGATPAAYLQSMVQAQSVAWAQNNQESLDQWLRKGPLGNAFFIFNLLLPGDWSNIPFPASRSIRMLLRDQNIDPVQHLTQNLFGPQGRGGIGVIRDYNSARLGIVDLYEQLFTHRNDSNWDKIVNGLTKTGDTPADPWNLTWDQLTKYPTTTGPVLTP